METKLMKFDFQDVGKPYLVVMVGLPASGKSTIAKQMAEDGNCIVLSSDTLRAELLGNESDQSNNDLVFRTLYKRAKEHLLNKQNVIIDATNISMKDRKRTLCNFERMDIYRVAYFVATPFEECVKRDSKRERTVGKFVIEKFLHRFQQPMDFEGFDNVVNFYDRDLLEDITRIQSEMKDFDQKNPHHKFTLGDHCQKCLDYLLISNNDNIFLTVSSELHDIGKFYTQTFDEKGIAHYYGHDNVGAYYLASNGYDKEIVFYVNYHMQPFQWNNEKTQTKYKKLFGEERFKNLLLLNECDRKASGNE